MKKTLVLGASTKPNRYSFLAIERLRRYAIDTVALGLKSGTVADINIDTEKKMYQEIHSITLYLNPRRQVEYYDYIVSLQPKRVIFNPGTENPELYKILKENAIEIEIACTLVLLSTNQY
ncbi:CoA-binding protein [Aquimarina sp. W85]|uniref:CoA-binding protein n=1 Tax=Aquimarina rhodophyticola TaxID=3342246 RepID=UPI00366AE395